MPKSSNRRKDGSVHSGRKAPDGGADRMTAMFGIQGRQGMQEGGPAGFEFTASGAGRTVGAPGGGPSAGGPGGAIGGGAGPGGSLGGGPGLGTGFGGASSGAPGAGNSFNQQQQAAINSAAEGRMKESIKRLAPVDWKSGDALWLIDMIAPFGGLDEAIKELKGTVFEGRTVKHLQPSPSGEGIAVVEW